MIAISTRNLNAIKNKNRNLSKEGLAMKTKIKFSLVITMTFIFAINGAGQETKSFLSVQDILSGWQSNYGTLNSMKVCYSQKIVSAEPSLTDPNITKSLGKYSKVERTEEGRKFISRFTVSEEKGFTDTNSVVETMFDGIHQKTYTPEIKQGQIFAGLAHKSPDSSNRLKHYLLSEPIVQAGIETEESEFAGRIKDALSDPNLTISVRPDLEEVSGQMCHVLDIEYFKKDKTKGKGSTIWVAHEKGMLPMKFQEFGIDTMWHEMAVEQIDFAKTENGGLWYPKKAYDLYNEPLSIGVIKYEFNVYEFVPGFKAEPNTFGLDFPNGTQVVDTELGISYTVGVK